MENVNKQLLDLVSSVLSCEIEACVFEQHVVPALEVARKVAAEQAQQAEPVAWESIEAIAADRYKVVPSHESMFYRFAVVAGDGRQQLYLGRKVECTTMARRFSGAFLDGAFAYQQILEKQPSLQPPAVADRDAIRRVFMAHGFTIKEGQADLKPYVYAAAEALLRELSPAVAVPDENAAFVEWAKEFGYSLETVNSERHTNDPYYTNHYTRCHWEAWKARAMLTAQKGGQ